MELENCVKAILYTYPKFKMIDRDYADHIENKAILSYRYKGSTESLAEYIAGEILRKRRLSVLKKALDEFFLSLTLEETILLELRYFGKIRLMKDGGKDKGVSEWQRVRGSAERQAVIAQFHWSERSYYRKQNRLLKKVMEGFNRMGFTKEVLEKEYMQYEFLRAVYRFLTAKKK